VARSLDLEFRLERARRLARALTSKGWTRTFLASKIGCDEKTIRNLLAGEEARDRIVIDVSQALGVTPELEDAREHVNVAEDVFGGYLRSTHRGYEGFFHLYRRSYTKSGAIFKSVVEIRWDGEKDRFGFSEYYQLDEGEPRGARAHVGAVYISSYTNLVHLLTTYEGSVRLITLTKMREPDGILRGSIQTQSESLMFFYPTISSICLCRAKEYDASLQLRNDIGLLDEGAADFAFASEQLEITERHIIKLVFPPAG
jgi:transcriptional regulator with XRE-family HTH domain